MNHYPPGNNHPGRGPVSFQQNIGFARNHVFTSVHPFLVSLLFYSLRGFLKTHTHLQENLYIGLFLFGGHVLTSRTINLFAYLWLDLTKGNIESWKRGFFPAIRTSCARPRQLTPVPWCILRIATFKMRPWANWKLKRKKLTSCFPWRIHGTGIFTYMNGWFFIRDYISVGNTSEPTIDFQETC